MRVIVMVGMAGDMDNITVLPGVERRDMGHEVSGDSVLRSAIDSGVTDAIVIGKRPSGEFYLAASDGNTDAVVGKIFYAATWLATHIVGRK
jgi:hypothetical protein